MKLLIELNTLVARMLPWRYPAMVVTYRSGLRPSHTHIHILLHSRPTRAGEVMLNAAPVILAEPQTLVQQSILDPSAARVSNTLRPWSVLFYECSDAAREDNHGHVTALDNRVIETAQIELVTQRVLCLRPQTVDLAVADFVSASLTRPGAIAINLAAHFLET
jgi:hypothetical protein